IMKIIQLQLYILICCQYAVADLLTDLGSNVSINCDLDENEVYWILLKTADPPTVILQSFSTSSFYPNKSFRKKYSVQFKHRLVINNVTADELGVYYCMNTRTPPKLSNSTRIYFTGEFIYSFMIRLVLKYIDTCHLVYCVFTITVSVISVSLDVKVVGFTGSSVVLPCSSIQHDLKPQDMHVLWRDKDSETIYDLIEGKDSLETQDPRYKNRAQTFPEEYKRGNFSIKLNNLTQADAGEFNCFITHSSYSNQETVCDMSCTITYSVVDSLSHYTLTMTENNVHCLFLLYNRMRS
uniref:Ig-like domain-containing protein n=1 Tax=Sinocyclocheilus grahami TaxID=75366 RepID=A0A672M6A0_SINGR